ncbi:uncharacterized protein C11orf16 homolog [Denticeps clupeoides]|uniref:Uncharacterized protein n=1 Tax=Denticeps clupeoides TaxID=299321 RepID=A0AAY4D690_9TELE|nr:uncharacterized protein C11orf16 homolog [Denticeps clupeoides]
MEMFATSQLPEDPGVVPLLVGTTGQNVTFALDASEAMGAVFGSVKEVLTQVLLTRASLRHSSFNIISFSYEVTRWRTHSVPCTPQTVFEALAWIHQLHTRPGRDLLAALAAAFSDPTCQAVHLLTNGSPDQPEECLGGLPSIDPRPVCVFLVSESSPLDARTLDFLRCLTCATRGSCHLLQLGPDGGVAQVSLLCAADQSPASTPHGCCSSSPAPPTSTLRQVFQCQQMPGKSTVLNGVQVFARSPASPWSTCVPGGATACAQMSPGCRVLARRNTDGFYYLATRQQDVLGRYGIFLVEFDKPLPEEHGHASPKHHLVSSCDMVNYYRAHAHSLAPGDTVLAPCDPQLQRYAPGLVLSGAEPREPFRVLGRCALHVLFWNGDETAVPPELAVWIPPSLHKRMVQELQDTVHHHGLQHCPLHRPLCLCCVDRRPSAPSCHCQATRPPAGPVLTCEKSLRDHLRRKVDLQLQDLQSPRETSAPSDSGNDSSSVNRGAEMNSQAVNTDLTLLRRAKTGTRPSWRYWRRSPAAPQQPVKNPMTSPSTLTSPSVNHSSLFDRVLDSAARKVTVREIFGLTEPKHSLGGKTS